MVLRCQSVSRSAPLRNAKTKAEDSDDHAMEVEHDATEKKNQSSRKAAAKEGNERDDAAEEKKDGRAGQKKPQTPVSV